MQNILSLCVSCDTVCLCGVVCGSCLIMLYWSKNWVNDRSKPTLPSIRSYDHDSDSNQRKLPTSCCCQGEQWRERTNSGPQRPWCLMCVYSTAGLTSQCQRSGAGTALATATLLLHWLAMAGVVQGYDSSSVLLGTSLQPQPSSNSRKTLQQQRQHHASQT